MSYDYNRVTAHRITRFTVFALLLLQSSLAAAVSTTQLDSFSDGTTQGWEMGAQSVTASHMTIITAGGPGGAGDNFLQVVAHDTPDAGGRLTFFNKTQWTGDYISAGITAIAMDLNNISFSETLNLRLAINGGFVDASFNFIGGLFATSASATLDSGSGWTHMVFSLLPGDLVPVSGLSGDTGNDVMAALGNVLELRLLNSAAPDWNGLPVSATLGIDNITAVPLPSALVLFASGLVALLAKRRRQVLLA
jgi:hypothetical protein